MSAKSRRKGSDFETEARKAFEEAGYSCVKTGAFAAHDLLVSLNGQDLIVECKRRANGFASLYRYLEQGDLVVHRDDRREPLITMPLSTFFSLRGHA